MPLPSPVSASLRLPNQPKREASNQQNFSHQISTQYTTRPPFLATLLILTIFTTTLTTQAATITKGTANAYHPSFVSATTTNPALIWDRRATLSATPHTFTILATPGNGWRVNSATTPAPNGDPIPLTLPPATPDGKVNFTIQRDLTAAAGTTDLLTVTFATHGLKPDGNPDRLESVTPDAFIVPDVTTYDYDGNGLPDLWEIQHFGDRGIDPNGNPDFDQYSSQEEWTNSTDPNHYDGGPDFRLLGRWQFDEGFGNTFQDEASNPHPGTLHGNYQWRTDPDERRYIEFSDNQAGATIEAPDLVLGDDGADFTVTFWFKLLGHNTGLWREMVRKSGSDWQRTFALWLSPHTSQIHARISGVTNSNLGIWQSANHLAFSEWSHVAYVKRSDRLELYVNGMFDSSEVFTEPIVGNNGPITIGKAFYEGIHAGYDDLRIYNAALSPEEIATLQIVADADPDHDGLTNEQELALGTNRNDPDTDYDGNPDNADPDPLDSTVFNPVRLGHWTFNASSFLSDSGKPPLLNENNTLAVPGIQGRALDILPSVASRLTLAHTNADGSANINLRRGTIRFWYRPDWTTRPEGATDGGPLSWARLLEVGGWPPEAHGGFWGLHLNDPTGSQILFSVFGYEANTIIAGGGYSNPFTWTAGEWHQITVTYSPTASKLFIDGNLKLTGAPSYLPTKAAREKGFTIGTNYWTGERATGQIDELETFNYELNLATITSNYAIQSNRLTAHQTNGGIPPDWENRYFPPGSANAIPTDPAARKIWWNSFSVAGGMTNGEKATYNLDPTKKSTKDINIPDSWGWITAWTPMRQTLSATMTKASEIIWFCWMRYFRRKSHHS